MIRKGLKPKLKLGLDLPREGDSLRLVLPFKRSWPAILILAAMATVFMLPAVATFRQAMSEWSSFESLSDLVAALFLSAWLLGWMTAPILMIAILVMLMFGREVLKASPGNVEIFFGLPFIGVTARYDVSKMRNFRFKRPPKKSSTSWRGPHLIFDYGANTVALGSDINADEVVGLRSQVQFACGEKIRRGEALPAELQPQWKTQETVAADLPASALVDSRESLTVTSLSSMLLIIANIVPLAGHVFLAWNLADVMVLYWAESAIIGFFNVCKMIVIGRWSTLLAGPFFIGHFGGFMAVHFLFLYMFFIRQGDTTDDLTEVAKLFLGLWPALLALFISHGFSFLNNFLGRREYIGRTINQQMSEPYSRIIFMHLVLIIGGGLSMILGGPKVILLLVIVLKIVIDVKAHLKQHAGN